MAKNTNGEWSLAPTPLLFFDVRRVHSPKIMFPARKKMVDVARERRERKLIFIQFQQNFS